MLSPQRIIQVLFSIRGIQLFGIVCCIIGSAFSQDSTQANLGIIKGTVNVSTSDDLTEEILRGWTLNRYGPHNMNHRSSPEQYTLSEKAVIYIESMKNNKGYNVPASHPQLKQQEMLFRPLVLPVLVGTTVDFPNDDNLFHNVFSYSQPKEFDLGRYPKGERKPVVFDKPGVVNVYCDIHSYMFAVILVLENPFYASPDSEGNYSIINVPSGNYQLSFWYGRKKVETKRINVKAGQPTIVDFSY